MHIAPDDVEASIVRPKHPHSQVHAKSGVVGSGKASEDKQYFHAIAEALKGNVVTDLEDLDQEENEFEGDDPEDIALAAQAHRRLHRH